MQGLPDLSTAAETSPSGRLASACRALGLLALVGASIGFLVGNLAIRDKLDLLLVANRLSSAERLLVVASTFGQSLLAAAAGAIHLACGRARAHSLELIARRLVALAPIALVPLLFRRAVWSDREISFLVLVMLWSLTMWAALRTAAAVPALSWEQHLAAPTARAAGWLDRRIPGWRRRWPVALVLAITVCYVAYFGYYTYCFHRSGRSGYALGVYDNLHWNILHGGPFFRATPRSGPVGSHFGIHAEPLAFLLTPFYALHRGAASLLVIQTVLIGAGAPALYALARRHVGSGPACIIALAYLFYPALHGENLFDFHFLPLAPVFLWSAWTFLELRRNGWAALFLGLTLAVHEDVAMWVVVLGVHFLLSGRRPRAGAVVAAVGAVYFVTIKFLVMPLFGSEGGQSTEIYRGLLAPGTAGFDDVLATVFLNPGFTASMLARTAKLAYVLHLLVPLALIPLRAPHWLLLCLPGILFTLLPTDYRPVVSISHQYSAHWIAFLFPAVALALESMQRRPPAAAQPTRSLVPALVAIMCATIPVSHQFGALLQQQTARAGAMPFVFGLDAEGRRRSKAMAEIRRLVPARAKVAGSRFVTPMLSNRPEAYNIDSGIHDAEYLVFPILRADFLGNELAVVGELLYTGQFGVVAAAPPYVVARRGHSTALNPDLLGRLKP